MRVLHVSPSMARSDGGPSEVLHGLLPALRKLHDVDLFTTTKHLVSGEKLPTGTVACRSIGPGRANLALHVVRTLESMAPDTDVGHIHGIDNFVTSVALRVFRKHRVPVVLQPHGALNQYHSNQRSLLKSRYRELVDADFHGVSAMIVSTEAEQRDAVAAAALPARIVRLGVDEDLFVAPRQHLVRPLNFLFLGRMAEKKRVDLVLHAFARPEIPANATLSVAGPLGKDLKFSPEMLAAQLGISERVRFLGQVDPSMRMRLLSEATAFVLPSDDESFGVAVAEALAAACPVVVSRHVGIAGDILRSNAGIVVGQSPAEIANGMMTAATQIDAIGRRGRALALRLFTWPGSAQQLAAVYEDVTA